MPLLAAYVHARAKARKPRRLYDSLPELVARLRKEHENTELYHSRWGNSQT